MAFSLLSTTHGFCANGKIIECNLIVGVCCAASELLGKSC